MATIPVQSSGGFLFAESAFAAGGLCDRRRARRIERTVKADPDSVASRWRRVFCFDPEEVEGVPLVQVGCGTLEDRQGLLEADGRGA